MLLSNSMKTLVTIAILLTGALTLTSFRSPDESAGHEQAASPPVMLILRGISSADSPRGQLDEDSALQFAGRLGFAGDVLDVAGEPGVGSPQFVTTLKRIRTDENVAAIYGFSGGGYNARLVWKELTAPERQRIRKIIVVGSPEVTKSDFPGDAEVLIQPDPPEGHMAGPKVLLDSLNSPPERRGS